jgi:hypothetical protein
MLNRMSRHTTPNISKSVMTLLLDPLTRRGPAPHELRATSEISELHLSFDEHRALHEALDAFPMSSCAAAIGLMDRIGGAFRECISQTLVESLEQFSFDERVALIVRNLPTDQLPKTPYESDPELESCKIVQAAILGAFHCLGIHPVSYEGENDDSIFRHVAPKASAQNTVSSYGSLYALDVHADNPHLPLVGEPVDKMSCCPEYLSLAGMRCEVAVPTRIVSVHSVFRALPGFVQDELMRPHYAIRRPESFAKRDYEIIAPVILRSDDGTIRCRFNQANMRALTPSAEFALKMFSALANALENQHRILLRNGDLLVFKNQQALHARDSFEARFDGTDRWMIRVFGVSDTKRVFPVSADRPFVVSA